MSDHFIREWVVMWLSGFVLGYLVGIFVGAFTAKSGRSVHRRSQGEREVAGGPTQPEGWRAMVSRRWFNASMWAIVAAALLLLLGVTKDGACVAFAWAALWAIRGLAAVIEEKP